MLEEREGGVAVGMFDDEGERVGNEGRENGKECDDSEPNDADACAGCTECAIDNTGDV